MKSIRRISVLTMILFSLITSNVLAQEGRERHPNRRVVVERKRHHFFRRAVIYHPYWAPRVNYRHRWVYFPRYNFYWDNFHNVYVYRTGTIWVTSTNAPQEVEKFDLSSVKKVELNENNDSKDAIQNNNDEHKSVYKLD
jgi:hypothetical protein